ncbi:zinc-dependent metalloprotease [Kribbella turkmenica]|uniref:Zinc-dependent metalloprotease n=1 Tax=Kribbella turkmenica TaxID=2530375 RepID=A0A4R4WV37_9ACTN|nr:zinc-dependent metalloprotease [Kribbella turkmenica]TDD21540.1 zinc-dependent metalloprotease [Kribbella turkmenica]
MSDEPDNPFKGTPFEAMFQQFSGAAGAGGPDLNAIFAQVQQLLSGSGDGKPVNWELAKDIARKTVSAGGDRSITPTDSDRVADAVRLAEHWLNDATTLPDASSTSAAWSRAEWVENTLPVWQTVVDPVAEHVAGAMGNALPAEAQQLAGPMAGMLRQLGGSIFGAQVGQGLGELAGEVVSSSDIGLPLGPTGQAVLLPDNVAKFAEGLGLDDEDVRLYLALREVAHQRLYAGVPWLRQHVLAAIADYAAGIEVDTGKIERAMADIDPQNPEAMQEALAGGLFEPEDSEQQKAALVRLETNLALVEGWVDDVVRQATKDRMPSAVQLAETVRRRRAAGGPAEQTFATLVGLQLRPRRLRDAANLWAAVRDARGVDGRDELWSHPDLLPSAADLDDPIGFAQHAGELADIDITDFLPDEGDQGNNPDAPK